MKLCLTFLALLLSANTYAQAAKSKIKVNFIILQENNGQGNEAWTKDNAYIDAVLARINAAFYSQASAQLVRGTKQTIKDSRLYHSPMSDGGKPLIKQFDDRGVKGAILVVVAREDKVDVNGRAERQGTDYSPVMIIRTVVNDLDPASANYVAGTKSAHVTAGLIVHELGHMMDLRHGERNSTSVNTENYTTLTQGINLYRNYLSKLQSYAPKETVQNSLPSTPVNPVPVNPTPVVTPNPKPVVVPASPKAPINSGSRSLQRNVREL